MAHPLEPSRDMPDISTFRCQPVLPFMYSPLVISETSNCFAGEKLLFELLFVVDDKSRPNYLQAVLALKPTFESQ